MANILGFVGIGVSGVALLFAIIAIALPQWQTYEVGSSKINAGLWDVCTEIAGNKVCVDYDSDSLSDEDLSKFQAVRAMVMLGLLLSAGAIVVGILVLFVMKSTKILFFVAGGLDIAAGLFLMIGMAIYADKIYNDQYDYGAAFALDIVAWIAAWAGGGIFIAAKIMDKE